MHFFLDKGSDYCIPPNCTSIRLRDPSKLIFLCTFLQHNTTVEEVDLGCNQIEDEGTKAIVELLKVNCTVVLLDLRGNQIGDEGAKAIAKALKVNRTVTKLYLSSNQIGDEGAKAIAEALKVNCTITTLNLWGNRIGDEGAKTLAEALKVNCTIMGLYLWGNGIDRELEKAFGKEIQINISIERELKKVVAETQRQIILFKTVPIYVLLDIHELIVILDLERKTNSHKFYNNHSFLKLLESKVSKKRLLNILDKITRAINSK